MSDALTDEEKLTAEAAWNANVRHPLTPEVVANCVHAIYLAGKHAAIEECARMVDAEALNTDGDRCEAVMKAVAKAIRALAATASTDQRKR